MRKLTDILSNLDYSLHGNENVMINNLVFDSRKVEKGDLFAALKGVAVNGEDYINKAIQLGANTILTENLPSELSNEVCYIKVKNAHEALGKLASNFYDNPSEQLNLVGITGTNGKSTCVTLLFDLFTKLGYKCGLISTIEYKIGEEIIPATHTTPDVITLNKLLDQMVEEGCEYCFMEVSSHAIHQYRIEGLNFKGAVFTNITHDHLDYHGTFLEYINTKKRFFDNLNKNAFALTNLDDKSGKVMLQNTKAKKYAFSISKIADFKSKVIENSWDGLMIDIDNKTVVFKMLGNFNASNLTTVYATAMLLEQDSEEVLTYLSALEGARGRMEVYKSAEGKVGIVDYAHTPDALENVLKTIQEINQKGSEIITVVGCGGDRDVTKRPKMANIACKYSDKVYLTSDNPRTEDPSKILEDMMQGISSEHSRKYFKIEDRKDAIRMAVLHANDNDVILVAGKGHETYQEINGERFPFDDSEIIKELLNN